jgi:hypothetical protein
MSLLSGKGLLIFLVLWIVGGQRPYPRWLKTALGLGWLSVGGLILYLLFGREPRTAVLFAATLAGLWSGLVIVAVMVVARQGFVPGGRDRDGDPDWNRARCGCA